MPHPTILAIEHPVVLIREIQHFTRNAAFLENVEERDALDLRDAVVERIMHNEVWRRPGGDVVDRVPAVVVAAVGPRGCR